MNLNKEQIENFMMEAILEGRRAREKCTPNPPVGCVLVRNGSIIAKGHTNEPGKHHAEAMALAQIDSGKGVTAFVTLEPCSFQGRTPSCAQALVDADIEQVFVALIDPDPRNNGAGIAMLTASGIEVSVGVLADLAQQDLGPHLGNS